jgi:hypothetical protein
MKKIIMMQAIFLIGIAIAIFIFYPKMKIEVNGSNLNFNSINANAILISDNAEFSNARYVELGKGEEVNLNLKPGTYYWKASNKYLEGIKQKIEIDSEVGMKIENESIENIGNVKINVTKNSQGELIGHVILEPEQAEKIENETEFIGRQA